MGLLAGDVLVGAKKNLESGVGEAERYAASPGEQINGRKSLVPVEPRGPSQGVAAHDDPLLTPEGDRRRPGPPYPERRRPASARHRRSEGAAGSHFHHL